MAKKTFSDSESHLDRFFSEPSEAQKTLDTYETDGTSIAQKYYRLNLKLKTEYREYLKKASWETQKSVTQYLNDLVEADKNAKG